MNYLRLEIPVLMLLSILLIVSCQNSEEQESKLDLLVDMMTGSFDSAAQAETDEEFFEIHLQMVSVWEDRGDGPWLYVEQAAAGYLDQPYRQRVYRIIERDDTVFESQVFLLPDPEHFIGAWKNEDPLAELSPSELIKREGCSVFLTFNEAGFFEGSTNEHDCPSDLRGASYATSEVIIYPNYMLTWDRGYDADHNQVWGSTGSGYRFDRSQ